MDEYILSVFWTKQGAYFWTLRYAFSLYNTKIFFLFSKKELIEYLTAKFVLCHAVTKKKKSKIKIYQNLCKI